MFQFLVIDENGEVTLSLAHHNKESNPQNVKQ